MGILRRYSCVLAVAFAACAQEGPSDIDREARTVNARATGDVTAVLDKSGWFNMTGDQGAGPNSVFVMGAKDEINGTDVLMWLRSPTVPEPGTYTLAPAVDGTPSSSSFAATFSQVSEQLRRRYVAEGGTIRVTSSSADQIEGTFDFTAILYCRATNEQPMTQSYSCRPSEVDATAPRIRVTGSFSVARDTADVGVMLPE